MRRFLLTLLLISIGFQIYTHQKLSRRIDALESKETTLTLPSSSPTSPLQTIVVREVTKEVSDREKRGEFSQSESVQTVSAQLQPSSISLLKELHRSMLSDFNTYDSDKDSAIDLSEANLTPVDFSQFDWDGDGTLDRDELEMTQRYLDRTQRYADRHDKRRDGYPIERENHDGSQSRFNFIDQNRDGVMTGEEYFGYLKTVRKERRRFDLNGDGGISLEEFGNNKPRFEAFDRDKDSQLEEGEVGDQLSRGRW